MSRGAKGFFRVIIAIGGHKTANNGLHVIEGNGGATNFRTMAVSGNLQLKKGQYTSVFVYSSTDNSYKISSESGFSCNQFSTAVGFRADIASTQVINNKGFAVVATSWRTSGEPGLYYASGSKINFDVSKGELTVLEDGIYFCSAQIRVDNANSEGLMRLLVTYNKMSETNTHGFSSLDGFGGSTNYRSLAVAGTIKLYKKDTFNVWIYSSDDASYSVHSESGWGCHLMATTIGFNAVSDESQQGTQGWTVVNSWWVARSAPEQYMVRGGTLYKGFFVVPIAGHYTCSVQLRVGFGTSASNYFRVILAINGLLNFNQGFSAVSSKKTDYKTMYVDALH